MWQEIAEQKKFIEKCSLSETYKAVHTEYPDIKTETIRGHIRRDPRYKEDKPEVIGVIGDTHFPFVHPNYINFLEDTFRKHRVTRVMHCGDLVDHHSISRFQSEPDSDGANTEFELAQKNIEIYTRTFDKVDIVLGNHDLIPIRQAATLGIPKQFLKGFKELWNLPKGWTVDEQLIINDVLYEHGTGTLGKNGALDKAINAMISCVIGHSHGFGGCQYKSNSKSLIFGLNVGCGIAIDEYAFRYGKYNKNRETLGCGIVFDSANAIFVPMGAKLFRR
jgi:predicted phosphodiesterase